MRLIIGLISLLLAGAAHAQVTPNNPPGSDSMSRAVHPEVQTRSAPEAAARSDSATQAGARESEVKRREVEPPNQPGTRPDQQR